MLPFSDRISPLRQIIFFVFILLSSFLNSDLVSAQSAKEPWQGAYTENEFAGGEIRKVYCDLVNLVEGAFGGLLLAAAGLMAFGFAAFGVSRHGYTAVTVGVSAFAISAAVSLYFGDLGCSNGAGGGQVARTKSSKEHSSNYDTLLEKHLGTGTTDTSEFAEWASEEEDLDLF
jgi:hypothetical protein